MLIQRPASGKRNADTCTNAYKVSCQETKCHILAGPQGQVYLGGHRAHREFALAADRTRLDELEQAVRDYLAWRSIEDERETLNLDAFQTKQTQTKRQDADETIHQRIPRPTSGYCARADHSRRSAHLA